MESDETRLRRFEDDLNVSGTGVIVMGAWAAVKTLAEMFLGTDSVFEQITEDTENRVLIIVIAIVMILIILSVVMFFHIYVGLNAIKASKGIGYKKTYLFFTVIMLMVTLAGFIVYKDIFKDMKNIDTSIASLLVDLTTVYIYVAVIRSTYMINSIKKKQLQE